MKPRWVHFALSAVLALMIVGTARADISGSAWVVTDITAQNAIPGNVPGTPANLTFTVPTLINFDSRLGGDNNINPNYAIGDWLATGGATNIVYSGGLTSATLLDVGGNGMIFDFTGMVTVVNGQTFTVTHDDGLTLNIGALNVINLPGPHAPITDTLTYTGPSGNLPFELVYGECCGAPAVLQIDLPLVNAPEPSSAGLLGVMLLGFAPLAVVFRRKWFS